MNIAWDSGAYAKNFSFVHEYGEDVLCLIDAAQGAFVIDLGCGTGALTKVLCTRGYEVLGIDSSKDMLSLARKENPGINFICDDALSFVSPKPADVVFSNAVFHWIDKEKQLQLLSNIALNMKKGGQLVCEFGGAGCAEKVHSMLEKQFALHGLPYTRTFYFPTIGQYAPLLEKAGFRVEFASLFDRPTPQKTDNGLADWIRMFTKKQFENVENVIASKIISDTVCSLAPVLYKSGRWFIDYVRIRIKARKL